MSLWRYFGSVIWRLYVIIVSSGGYMMTIVTTVSSSETMMTMKTAISNREIMSRDNCHHCQDNGDNEENV